MKVAMIGAGYVGLVSGACFAEFGASVVCIDKVESRIAALEAGQIPIYEPGLDALVRDNVAAGRLRFARELAPEVSAADLVFIAVGTPMAAEDGRADLSYVEAAAREIAGALSGYTVIVTKSTVPMGTGRWLENLIRQRHPQADFDVASNPEFLREGNAIADFMRPDRVVIGTQSSRAAALLRQLYRPLEANATPLVCTTLESAELIKYAANAFLATKVSFINEVADLCEAVGADVETVSQGIGLDRRIGHRFLQAGPGYGGSCFPKDTRALVTAARTAGAPLRIIETVLDVNERRKESLVERILGILDHRRRSRRLALLGVTFKPDTDDMREAPALKLVPALQAAGLLVHAYDPAGTETARPLLPGVSWCSDAYGAMEGADALVILTEWEEFRSLDLERVRELLHFPLVIDLRNVYAPAAMGTAGLEYHSIGRPAVLPAVAPQRVATL